MAVEATLGFSTDKLGDIAKIKTGSRNNQDKYPDGQFPFFVRSQEVERINTFSYSDEAILIPGEGNIGEIVHYVNEPHEVHQRVYRISNFDPKVYSLYVYWYLRVFFKAHTEKYTVKATVDSLRLPTFQEFEITYPDIEEQKAIAKALSDIDDLICVLNEQKTKVLNLFKATYESLFLDCEEWDFVSLRDLGTFRTASRKQTNHNSESDFIILDMGSVDENGNVLKTKFTNSPNDLLPRGSIVIPKDDIGGGKIIGKGYCVKQDSKYVLGDHVFALIIHNHNPDYIRFALNRRNSNLAVLKMVVGSAQLGLPKKVFEKHELPIPDIDKQNEIVDVLSNIESELEFRSMEIQKYECIKQGMMNDLLTGKVRLV